MIKLLPALLIPMLTQAAVLVSDDFNGPAGSPNPGLFAWGGEVTADGAGYLQFQTWSTDTTWLRSQATATPGQGETLELQFRAYAYAEDWHPGIYGDGQPRGLRIGNDPNNAVEFYSLARTAVGMRVRKNGVEELASYAFPPGVDSMHDYGISVTTTGVTFTVDGAFAGTLATVPTGALNFLAATYDGGAGNVPVTLDRVLLTLIEAPAQAVPAITEFSPTIGPVGASVFITGTNLAGVTNVLFGGTAAWFTNNSDTLITTRVPATAANGVITLAFPGGTLSTTNRFIVSDFDYVLTNGFVMITGYLGTNTQVVIPVDIDGHIVFHIGASAFQGRTALTSVTLPGPLVSIGPSAFFYCINLTNVPIPSYVTNIGEHAFSRCEKLTAFWVSPWSFYYTNISGVLFTKDRTVLVAYPGGKGGSYTIPAGTKRIAPTAFAWCATYDASLTSVTMNSDLLDIGYGAFYSCVRLTSVTMSSSVTNVGAEAFYDCNTLPGITVPSTVQSIGDNCFRSAGLTNVSLPASVTYIGNRAFASCRSLTNISVAPANPNYCSGSGVLFDKTKTRLMQYPRGNSTITQYTIPSSVTSIDGYAFYMQTKLTSITIPFGVTNMGTYAFAGCSGLTSIVVPGSVVTFGDYVFWGCTGLKTAQFDGLTAIPTGFLAGCSGLTNLTIPDSVTSIGASAFWYCTGLQTVTMAENVTKIGNSAFANAPALANVYFPGNAPSIGTNVFGQNNLATIYYLPGTSGWESTLAGRPAVLWNPKILSPQVQDNAFGFAITGASNMTVVVSACTNLASPVWKGLQTNVLGNTPASFSDLSWTNYPRRFYRLNWP